MPGPRVPGTVVVTLANYTDDSSPPNTGAVQPLAWADDQGGVEMHETDALKKESSPRTPQKPQKNTSTGDVTVNVAGKKSVSSTDEITPTKNTHRIDTRGEILIPVEGKARLHSHVFSIHPELIRLTAYAAFWVMVLLAYFVTMVFVTEDLDESPLIKMFGYNNVCILWDYEPATSIVAMFYPLVEIPLVLYIVLNFIRLYECHKAGFIATWKFILCSCIVPIEFILVLWFRMIFVVKAFVDVKGHTLGFHGLMIALCLVALQNYIYHDSIGKLVGPKWISLSYLILLWSVTSFKMIVAWSVFGGTPLWSVATVSGQRAAQFLDISWMVLGSVCPAIIAWKSRLVTPAMVLAYATAPKGVY